MDQKDIDAARAKMKLIQKVYGNKPVETILRSGEFPKEANERLDIALSHLKKYNLGSFLWYKDNDDNKNDKELDVKYKNREDKLISELLRRGVPKEEHLPIIYHLIEDGYVIGNWNQQEDKSKGQDPTQIKITYKGILSKGYVSKARIDFQNKIWSWIAKVIAIIGFVILLCNTFDIRRLQEKEEQEKRQKAYIEKIQSDSLKVFIVNGDTSLKHRSLLKAKE